MKKRIVESRKSRYRYVNLRKGSEPYLVQEKKWYGWKTIFTSFAKNDVLLMLSTLREAENE